MGAVDDCYSGYGGIQMIMLGVIGEYLWRALAQSRKRDLYVIDAVYDEVEEAK